MSKKGLFLSISLFPKGASKKKYNSLKVEHESMVKGILEGIDEKIYTKTFVDYPWIFQNTFSINASRKKDKKVILELMNKLISKYGKLEYHSFNLDKIGVYKDEGCKGRWVIPMSNDQDAERFEISFYTYNHQPYPKDSDGLEIDDMDTKREIDFSNFVKEVCAIIA